MDYLDLANHPIVFILCALVILVVLVMALLFVWKAWGRGVELGMSKKVLKTSVTNTILLSIVPSLPIIVMMLALSVPLGRYFPWMRLSMVGSAVYEGTAANLAVQNQGLTDIADPNMTPRIFLIVMFVMTVGIIWGIVFNIFFMESLDKFIKKTKESAASNFVGIFSAALFTALLVTLSIPYVGDIQNINSIISYIVAGMTVILCQYLAKKFNKRVINDFSLPIALFAGMGTVILVAYIF